MSVLIDTETQEFAVISIHNEPCREQLVLAYRDEKSLRDCLAEASILAVGYHSREEALEHMDRCAATERASAQKESAGLCKTVAKFLTVRGLGRWTSAARFDSSRARSLIGQLIQHGFVCALVLIYSKNAFSAMVRALVSF
jgi:hypothetical protein